MYSSSTSSARISRGQVGHLTRPPTRVSLASELRRMTWPQRSTTGGLSRSASSRVTGQEKSEWKVNSGGSATSAGKRSPTCVQSPSLTTTASILARMGTNCRPATKVTSRWLCMGRPSASQPTSMNVAMVRSQASSPASATYGEALRRPAQSSAPMQRWISRMCDAAKSGKRSCAKARASSCTASPGWLRISKNCSRTSMNSSSPVPPRRSASQRSAGARSRACSALAMPCSRHNAATSASASCSRQCSRSIAAVRR
mmetsp:Transcript_36719/g.115012  ORF Transcript_36719/g.115012 Transcript_36719/m.115012 type:complete len:257 (-) Transcript_36719:503-1273(-)